MLLQTDLEEVLMSMRVAKFLDVQDEVLMELIDHVVMVLRGLDADTVRKKLGHDNDLSPEEKSLIEKEPLFTPEPRAVDHRTRVSRGTPLPPPVSRAVAVGGAGAVAAGGRGIHGGGGGIMCVGR